MARLTKIESYKLEQREGMLGCLGNAMVLLELVEMRVRMVGHHQPGILYPAMEDLMRARRLIERTQQRLTHLPLPPPQVINAAE